MKYFHLKSHKTLISRNYSHFLPGLLLLITKQDKTPLANFLENLGIKGIEAGTIRFQLRFLAIVHQTNWVSLSLLSIFASGLDFT